ncbi:Guanine nucleotide exchange factor, N-terminal [Phytophthora cactorum]|nr:Guanine nucleotide exchange factor, N-terminal [Phytophthora cactorum]
MYIQNHFRCQRFPTLYNQYESTVDRLGGVNRTELQPCTAERAQRDRSADVRLRYQDPKPPVLIESGINSILDETTGDDDGLVCVREICQETLSRMDRVTAAKSIANRQERKNESTDVIGDGSEAVNWKAFSPPKSRQKTLSKPKLSRRPSLDSAPAGEMPRWKIIDGNEAPITDITRRLRSRGFTKVQKRQFIALVHWTNIFNALAQLERSPSGQRADLNKGGRDPLSSSSGKAPISEIIAIFPERGEFVPTDYEVVRRRGVPANITTREDLPLLQALYHHFDRRFGCHVSEEKRTLHTGKSSNNDFVIGAKRNKLVLRYMKVDKSPLGHAADLNANSGAQKCSLATRRRYSYIISPITVDLRVIFTNLFLFAQVASISDLHKKWLFASVTPTQVLERARSPPPAPSTPGKLKQLRSAFALKAAEVREQELITAPHSPSAFASPDSPYQSYYMYPLLLACYTRHGNAAEAAVTGLTHCLEEGVFDCPGSDLCRLEVVIDAVTSICQQGVKSRFEPALKFFQKVSYVIRKCTNGFNPSVLHAILNALTFIGDFDGSLTKSFEDELISKIMGAYEASLINTAVKKNVSGLDQSSNALAHELVVDLIDDISTGAEIATITDTMLGVFKAEKNALQLVVTFSKAINRKFVSLSETATESDQRSSVNSLRALNQTLLSAGARAREQRVFGQVVRRFVLSTLNATVLTWVPDVFRANLTLVSTLWNHYRRYLKVELALMFEHVLLRILRSTAPCTKNHQLEIMHEMTNWLQLPHNVVEIFLNFDLDRIHSGRYLSICSIGEGSVGHLANGDEGDDSALELQNQAINTILAMARSVMDASGHAHLISRDRRTRMLSMYAGGWEQDESGEEASH